MYLVFATYNCHLEKSLGPGPDTGCLSPAHSPPPSHTSSTSVLTPPTSSSFPTEQHPGSWGRLAHFLFPLPDPISHSCSMHSTRAAVKTLKELSLLLQFTEPKTLAPFVVQEKMVSETDQQVRHSFDLLTEGRKRSSTKPTRMYSHQSLPSLPELPGCRLCGRPNLPTVP